MRGLYHGLLVSHFEARLLPSADRSGFSWKVRPRAKALRREFDPFFSNLRLIG
jgi:hypothetical protein